MHSLVNELISVKGLKLIESPSTEAFGLFTVQSWVDKLFSLDVVTTSTNQVKHLSYLCNHAQLVTLNILTLFRLRRIVSRVNVEL